MNTNLAETDRHTAISNSVYFVSLLFHFRYIVIYFEFANR